jgi:hypothetical protein
MDSRQSSTGARTTGRRLAALLGSFLLAGLVACGGGDGDGSGADADSAAARGSAASPLSGAAGGTMSELRRVQQRLSRVQDSALAQPSLEDRRQEIDSLIQSTMQEISPGTGEELARFDSLRARFETARSEGDTATARNLVTQLQQLQRSLQETRAQAIEDDQVAAVLDTFRDRLLSEMEEIDPATDSLMDVADSLRQDLQSSMQGHPGMGGGSAADTGAAGGQGSGGG